MHRVHSSANKDVRFTASNVHVRPDIGKTLHMQAATARSNLKPKPKPKPRPKAQDQAQTQAQPQAQPRPHMQKLAIDARGLKLEIHSSDAPAKYVGRRAHLNTPAKYMHLNLGFPNGIPKGASGGVFAEMAGIAPMTQRTREVLRT